MPTRKMVFFLHFLVHWFKNNPEDFMRSDVREGVQIYIMSDIKPNFTHLVILIKNAINFV